MMYLGILLGIGIMAAMIYMAFDKKASFSVKIASLLALGIMVLTVIICLVIIFTDNTVPVDPSVLIVGEPPKVKEGEDNSMVLLLLVIFLVVLFALVAILSIRDHKKNLPKGRSGVTSSLW